jgi:hypothetical protein
MPDTKITALAAITTVAPAADLFPIVDVSDNSMAASGTTKNITVNQLLGAGGTATLASATISGDLTVATDRFKVVTGSTAVQIGATTQTQFGTTAWPTSYIGKSGSRVLIGSTGELILWNEAAAAIGNNSTLFIGAKSGPVATLIAGGAIKGGIENTSDYSGFLTLSTQRSDASMIERYRIDSTGVSTWSVAGTTAMTLNSTGLGVGVASPSYKLDVRTAPATAAIEGLRVSDATRMMISGQTGATYSYIGIGGNQNVIYSSNSRLDIAADGQSIFLRSSAANYLNLDASGNVGIGVTPSYKLDTQVAGGADRSILRAAVTGVSGGFQVKWNNATSKIHAIIENIPTSSAGLPSGTLWSDSGTIKIA